MPQDPINDAIAYGVEIEPVDVPAGTIYWRVVRVHHLTPEENHGNHHIYLDALDEDGNRVFGAQALVTWEGGEQTVTIDKPVGEPGTNFPMWKWQVCAVEMLSLPSDRVVNLHTGHPDEPPGTGNTLFHHSFQVDFQRSTSGTAPPPEESTISGVVTNGDGLTLLLLRDESVLASTVLDASGAFAFENLAAGLYVLSVEGTDVRSDPLELDGTNSVTIDLEVPEVVPGKVLVTYVLFPPVQSPRTAVYLALARDYLLQEHPAFGFRVEDAAQAQKVILLGGLEDIGADSEAALVDAGCQVRRIQGTAQEIAAALEGRTSGSHGAFMPAVPVS